MLSMMMIFLFSIENIHMPLPFLCNRMACHQDVHHHHQLCHRSVAQETVACDVSPTPHIVLIQPAPATQYT